jgi:hypothetical protein
LLTNSCSVGVQTPLVLKAAHGLGPASAPESAPPLLLPDDEPEPLLEDDPELLLDEDDELPDDDPELLLLDDDPELLLDEDDELPDDDPELLLLEDDPELLPDEDDDELLPDDDPAPLLLDDEPPPAGVVHVTSTDAMFPVQLEGAVAVNVTVTPPAPEQVKLVLVPVVLLKVPAPAPLADHVSVAPEVLPVVLSAIAPPTSTAEGKAVRDPATGQDPPSPSVTDASTRSVPLSLEPCVGPGVHTRFTPTAVVWPDATEKLAGALLQGRP